MRQISIFSCSREHKELGKDATITKQRFFFDYLMTKHSRMDKGLVFVFYFFLFCWEIVLFLLNFSHKYLHDICIFSQPIRNHVLCWESLSFWLYFFCFLFWIIRLVGKKWIGLLNKAIVFHADTIRETQKTYTTIFKNGIANQSVCL